MYTGDPERTDSFALFKKVMRTISRFVFHVFVTFWYGLLYMFNNDHRRFRRVAERALGKTLSDTKDDVSRDAIRLAAKNQEEYMSEIQRLRKDVIKTTSMFLTTVNQKYNEEVRTENINLLFRLAGHGSHSDIYKNAAKPVISGDKGNVPSICIKRTDTVQNGISIEFTYSPCHNGENGRVIDLFVSCIVKGIGEYIHSYFDSSVQTVSVDGLDTENKSEAILPRPKIIVIFSPLLLHEQQERIGEQMRAVLMYSGILSILVYSTYIALAIINF
jgi:hypothetical protein